VSKELRIRIAHWATTLTKPEADEVNVNFAISPPLDGTTAEFPLGYAYSLQTVVSPAGPVEPVAPTEPVAPAGPVAPAAPVAPVPPVPPVGPAGPVGPTWFQEIAVSVDLQFVTVLSITRSDPPDFA
jgi:hypothetical protein